MLIILLFIFLCSFKQSNSLKQERGYTTFVIHANTMNEKDFERYEKLFAEHKDKLISYQDYLKVSTEKRGVIGRVKEYLMAISKYVLVRVNSLRK